MSIQLKTVALAVAAVCLAPALAMACEEEAKAVQKGKVARDAKAAQKACVPLPQACATAVTAEDDGTIHRVVPAGTRRPDWEPGHLIERDSIKTVPEQKNEQPETWVKVSSRNGKVHPWRYNYKSSKKTKSRVVTAPGPRRS